MLVTLRRYLLYRMRPDVLCTWVRHDGAPRERSRLRSVQVMTQQAVAASEGTCPVCGQANAFEALGVRYEHPHRWQPWRTTSTALFLCTCCGALVVGGQAWTAASTARHGWIRS